MNAIAPSRPWGPCMGGLVLVGALGITWLAGCGGRAPLHTGSGVDSTNEPNVVDLTNPATPIPAEQFLKPQAAQIGPGDQLEIRILSYPELSGSFSVAPDGRINLPLVGSVQAAGRTATELDGDLTAAYSVYLRNLDLTVNVTQRAPRFVYVLGEVNHGNRFEFSPGDRVIHGLALAGGMTANARENSIVLMRRDQEGRDHAYRLDFSHMHTTMTPQDIYLQPGDVVFVPKSRFRTAIEFSSALIDVLSRTATTALVVEDITNLRNRAVTVSR